MIYLPTGSSNGLEINKPSGGGGGEGVNRGFTVP